MVAKLSRCPVGERRKRSHAILIITPNSQHGAGLGERRERYLVQALVAEPTVEAIDERVLFALSRLDVVPVDARPLAAGQDRPAGELGAIVGNPTSADLGPL